MAHAKKLDIENQHARSNQDNANSSTISENKTNAQIPHLQRESGKI